MNTTNHQHQLVRAVNVLILYRDEVQNDLIIIKIIAAKLHKKKTNKYSVQNL